MMAACLIAKAAQGSAKKAGRSVVAHLVVLAAQGLSKDDGSVDDSMRGGLMAQSLTAKRRLT